MINHTIHIGDVLMPVRVRSVTMSERGQIVIPEDMRDDLKMEKGEALVLIERENEIVLRKESDVALRLASEDAWDNLATESLKNAWDKSDDVWDKVAKEDLKWSKKK